MTRTVILFLVIATLLSACTGLSVSRQRINPDYSMVVTSTEDVERKEEILAAWFNCDECVSGQLRRIQEYGNTIIPELDAARVGNIPNIGDIRDAYELKCQRINARIVARGLVPPETCEQYVARAERSLKRRYELRGTEALLAIRTETTCNLIGRDRCENTDPFATTDFRLATDRSTREFVVIP